MATKVIEGVQGIQQAQASRPLVPHGGANEKAGGPLELTPPTRLLVAQLCEQLGGHRLPGGGGAEGKVAPQRILAAAAVPHHHLHVRAPCTRLCCWLETRSKWTRALSPGRSIFFLFSIFLKAWMMS